MRPIDGLSAKNPLASRAREILQGPLLLQKRETQEKQDARKSFSKDWTARIIGIAMVGGFLGYIFLVTLQPPEQNSEALINLVLGYLGGLASAVISFYFGASNKQD